MKYNGGDILKRNKIIDEMDRNIQLHSEGFGYKAAILALSIWTIVTSYRTIVNKTNFEILPVLILCFSISAQTFSRIAIKHRMVSGDEEYKEPNKLLRFLVTIVVIEAIVIFLGSWLLIRG